jgi:hypothetical protein
MVLLFTLSGCEINNANKNNNDDNTQATIDQNIEELNNNNQSQSSPKTNQYLEDSEEPLENSEKPIVLYHGITLDDADRRIEIRTNENEDEVNYIMKKYSREYYLYSNQQFLGKENGIAEIRGYDYYWEVNFQNLDNFEVAISQPYNPYPRKVTDIYSEFALEPGNFCTVISEVNNRFGVTCEITELLSVDLDGNGNDEYFIMLCDRESHFFAKCLLNPKYKIISYLTVVHEEDEEYDYTIEEFRMQNSSEIIDIDNDGIMEIIMQIPSYEGLLFEVFKYNNGNFDGKFITEASFQC